MRWLATIFALVFLSANAQSQVVFKGTTTAPPNKLAVITLEKVEGTGLKIVGFIDGRVPEVEEWQILKNLDNQVIIFLATDKSGVYTFVAAVTKDGKTFISSHVLVVGVPKPIDPPKPPVEPEPEDKSFKGRLKTEYKAHPDESSLPKLLKILQEVVDLDFKSYDEMETVLAKTGSKYLPNNELRKVRDLISDEIVAKCGTNASKRDVDKVKAVLNDAIGALK